MTIRTLRSLGLAALLALGTVAGGALPTAAEGGGPGGGGPGAGGAVPPSASPCAVLNGFDSISPLQVQFGQTVTVTAHLTSCSSGVEDVSINYTVQSPFVLSPACNMSGFSTSTQLKPGDTNKGVSSTVVAPFCLGFYSVTATVNSSTGTLAQASTLFFMFNQARNQP